MRTIILQHLKIEHPGILRSFMEGDGLSWDTVELDAGQPIPDLSCYDLMMVMGGPQDVWDEETYPWLRPEKDAIRRFVVGDRKPFLGICLGHQLLASAIGGTVSRAASPEIGVFPVSRTESGKLDHLFRGVQDVEPVLHWHSSEVTSLPEGCEVLASSTSCSTQAFRYGRHAWGLQYHIEVTAGTVDDWSTIPEYTAALNSALGPDAIERIKADTSSNLPAFNQYAQRVYQNLRGAVAAFRKGHA